MGRHSRQTRTRTSTGPAPRRTGQANLVALVAALVAVTTAMVLGVAVADTALDGTVRTPGDRHAATAVADRLVAADSPLANRSNVLDGAAVDAATAPQLRARYPVLDGRAFRVTLDDKTVARNGTVRDGTTMRRLVVVERSRRVTVEPEFSAGNVVTLPQRTPRVRVTVDSPVDSSVRTVRASNRTVLHAPDGRLEGTYTVSVSRRETVQFAFLANGTLERGDVTLELYPRNTTKAVLGVTVDG